MTDKQLLSKSILKKWWFWAIAVVVLGIIGIANGGSKTADTTDNKARTSGSLTVISKSDYVGKEALVVYKDLKSKGYTVTAKYVNENLPDYKRDLTNSFLQADINSCNDRLGFDAYLVGDLSQTNDSVVLALKDVPNNNQTCPAGTTDDRR